MHPYARLTPGPGFRPIRATFYFTHRLLPWPRPRRAVARLLAALIRLRRGTVTADATTHATRRQLDQDGIAPLPDLLSAAEIDTIHAWLRDCPLDAAGAYSLDTVLACPHVLRVTTDPRVLALAGAYLGCKPTLSSLGIRWSVPRTAAASVQSFHRDLDDWRFVKVFTYLTGVDPTTGPHVYVRGSHRTAGRLRGRPYQTDELLRRYGAAAILPILGPAGTSFVADTYGIHKGETPRDRPRLILQAQYSLLPNFALLYRPVAVPTRPAQIDPYTHRLIVAPPDPA